MSNTMNGLKTALKIELCSMYSLNRVRYTKDGREKKRYRLLAVSWVIVAAVLIFYVAGYVYALNYLGVGELTDEYIFFLSSVLVFAVGLFKSGNAVFSKKGYDILSSMPLSDCAVPLARLITLYLESLILAFAVALPAAVTYAVADPSAVSDCALMLVSAVFAPSIPLALSLVISTLAGFVLARVRHKSIAYSLFAVVTVVAVLVLSFAVPNFEDRLDEEMISSLLLSSVGVVEKLYPPTALISMGIRGVSALALISSAFAAATAWASVGLFHPIVRLSMATSARHDYKLTVQKSSGVVKALLIREALRYFASGIYVSNTIVGPIMGAVLSVGLFFVGLDTITASLPADISLNLTGALPLFLGAVFSLMTTTATSVSMEGSRFYIAKSLPLTTKQILDSKLLLWLILCAPFYAVSEIFMLLATEPSALDAVFTVLLPASVIVFSAVFGISVNLKLYNFSWETEVAVVKQSASAAVSMLSSLAVLLLGGLVLVLPEEYSVVTRAVSLAVTVSATAVLYSKNNKVRLCELE